jgi:elongation factor G
MPSYSTADIRNILLAGHGGSGKTTLADALLFATNMVSRKGSVLDGSSFSDFEKEEKEHKHSIYASVLHVNHAGKRINIIDAPGSPDLIGQAFSCFPAVETVVMVINAQSGIEVVTRRVNDSAKERNLPRAIVINKIDMPEVDLEGLIARIQDSFGPQCKPINLPANGGKTVVECLVNKTGQTDFSSVEEARGALMDQIVEIDEALMEKYLGGEEPTAAELHTAFVKAMKQGHLVPI